MMDHILYLSVLVLVISGLVCLGTVWFCWPWFARYYQSWYCKAVSELAKTGSAILGVSTLGDHFQLTYRVSCLIGFALSYLFWILASLVGDFKKSSTDRDHAQEKAMLQAKLVVAEGRSLTRLNILTYVKEIMINKKQKVWEQTRRIPSLTSSKNTRQKPVATALDPRYQAQQIIVHLAMFLRDQLPQGEIRNQQNFRVAFYVSQNGFLVPFVSFNLAEQTYEFLRAFQECEKHFELGCTNQPSQAVLCIVEDRTLVIEDCGEELTELRPNQFRYLKSMVAYPIKQFGSPLDHSLKACIVVDTNISGHFKRTETLAIESYMEQFGVRLDLEYSVFKLLEAKPAKPPRRTDG